MHGIPISKNASPWRVATDTPATAKRSARTATQMPAAVSQAAWRIVASPNQKFAGSEHAGSMQRRLLAKQPGEE
jgi:hypothetical protein